MPSRSVVNVPRFLNADVDERLLSAEEMPDALNVRGIGGDEGRSSILKNVKGNTLKSYTLPDGDNTVVGAVSMEETNSLYYFVSNTSGDHLILQYNSVTDTITKVLQDNILAFTPNNIVQGRAILLENGDTLLYFTDNLNPVRKINVRKAILHEQGDADGYPSPLTEEFIEVLKYPPVNKPDFAFDTEDGRAVNNVGGKMFQFSYRYIYDDGEVSVFSPYSDVAISDYYLQNSVYTSSQMESNNNVIDITLENGSKICTHIEVIFREGNDGEWKAARRIPNRPDQATQTFRFDNNGNYSVVSNVFTNKLFDNVPVRAKAIDIIGNRLMLGNYLDGYGNIEEIQESDQITVVPKYYERRDYENTTSIDVTSSVISPVGNDRGRLIYDFSTYTPSQGDYIFISTFVLLVGISGVSGKRADGVLYADYVVQGGDTVADITNNILNIFLSQRDFGGITITNQSSSSATSLVLRVRPNPDFNVLSINDASLFNNSFYTTGGLGSLSSFKAGANHPIGISYYDRGNRSTTVQKPAQDSTYIKFFSERGGGAIEPRGEAHLDFRIGTQPPVWATHYKLLYAQNTTVDEFLQYTCLKAFKPKRSQQTVSDARIYLSFRGFKGKEDSYRERLGAEIDYNFQEGDRLRIISYYDPDAGERVYANGYLDFRVLGIEVYDENDSPVIPQSNPSPNEKYNTTGYFIIVEDSGLDGWGFSDVETADGLWYNDTAKEGAFFEIYRPHSPPENQVYYETGLEYEIENAGTSSRSHKGGIRDQGETINYTVIAVNSSTAPTYIDINQSLDDTKLVNGDIISIGFSLVTGGLIRQIAYQSASTTRIYLDFEAGDGVLIGASVSLVEFTAASRIESGDVWMKPRLLRTDNNGNTLENYIDVVEDYYANDFLNTNSWNKGRANAYSENSKQVNRYQTITWSDPFFTDTNNNGFSSFNIALANFKELQNAYGSLQLIRRRGDELVCYQEDRVARVLVNKNVLFSAEGAQTVTLSANVLSEPSYYSGDYGIALNPESFAEKDDKHYWISLKRGKVLRLGGDGITPISDYNMRTFFDDLSTLYLSALGNVKIFGGYDRDNDEYFITFPNVTQGQINIDDTPIDLPSGDVFDDGDNIVLKVDIVPSDNASQPTLAGEERGFSDIPETFADLGSVVRGEKEIAESNTMYVPADDFEEYLNEVKTTPSGTIPAYIRNGGQIISGNLSMLKGNFSASKTQPNGTVLSLTTADNLDFTTISFSENANRWVSRWSFTPDFYGGVNMKFITFYNGDLYVHDTNDTYSNFYGTQYQAEFDIMVNDLPQVVKTFRACELQGNQAWDCTLAETDLVSSTIPEATFEKKDSFWYAKFLQATSGSTGSVFVGLGTVSAINSLSITITGFDLGSTSVSVGDVVYTETTEIGTITAVSQGVVSLNSVSGLSVSNFVYAVKSEAIDGDAIKGYYAKMKFVQTATTYSEIFAVRNWINFSMLTAK